MDKKYLQLVLLMVVVPSALYVNSTHWFRFKQAAFYKNKGEQFKEAQIYKKILRKQLISSKYKLDNEKEAATYLLTLVKNNLEEKSDLAWQYLNGEENFHIGMAQLLTNEPYYSEYTPVLSTLLPTEWDNVNSDIEKDKLSFCLNYAANYIEDGKLAQARDFLSDKITEYYSPVELIQELSGYYLDKPAMKNNIWGDEIYLVLENFKNRKTTILGSWASNIRSEIESHDISIREGFRASPSEYFKISYTNSGYDYWAFYFDIPLDVSADNIGLRVYVKSKGRFKGAMVANVIYPLSECSATIRSNEIRILEDGWQELIIKDIYTMSKTIADKNGWQLQDMHVDRVGIDISGCSGTICIDDFEMFIKL